MTLKPVGYVGKQRAMTGSRRGRSIAHAGVVTLSV